MEMKESEQKAEFNMAISYLNRINNAFNAANMAAFQRDAYGWLNALMIIYRELSTEISPDEIINYDKQLVSINNSIMRSYSSDGMPMLSAQLFMDLHNFELKLRLVTKKSGLQMKMTDDARKALQ